MHYFITNFMKNLFIPLDITVASSSLLTEKIFVTNATDSVKTNKEIREEEDWNLEKFLHT